MLTAANLAKLDAMASDECEDSFNAYQPAHHDGDDSGSSAAYDSDEERMDRLMTPREMAEVDEPIGVAGPTNPSSSSSPKFDGATAAANNARRTSHFHGWKRVQDESGSMSDSTGRGQGPNGATLWYFAYGSNMNVAQLLNRIGAFATKQLFYLPEYRIAFNKKVSLKESHNRLISNNANKCGFANVMPSPGDRVYGIGYLVNQSQIEKMDVYEGVGNGHYTRERMICYDPQDRPVYCEVYVACPTACADGLLPTDGYLSHLLGGRGLLPQYYAEMLQKQPTTKR